MYNRSSNIRKITKKVLPPHTKHRTAALHSTAKNFITCCGVATYTVVRIVHGDAPCPNCGSHCKSSMGGSPLFDRARVTSRLQCTGTTAMAAPSALSECGVSVVGSDPLHGADRALDCGPAYAGRVKVCFSTNPAAESLTTLARSTQVSIFYHLAMASRAGVRSFRSIAYAVKERVATITLNRPAAFNAIDRHMPWELEQAVLEANNDDSVHAIVLTGAGKGFCGG